jgi:hypothetical protein
VIDWPSFAGVLAKAFQFRNPGTAAAVVTRAACLIHSLRVSIARSPLPVESNHTQHWYA